MKRNLSQLALQNYRFTITNWREEHSLLPALRLFGRSMLSWATRQLSLLMGQPFTNGETLRVVRASAAAACLMFPAQMPLWLRAFFLALTALALWKCRDIKLSD